MCYEESEFSTYKNNIFVNEIDNVFYPLIYKQDNGRSFKYNSTILNKVIFSDIVKSYNYKNNKGFEISNDWSVILKKYIDIDTSNIVIDLEEAIKCKMEDSDSSDEDINLENLTEEMQSIKNRLNSDDSDRLSLDSEEESESDEENELEEESESDEENELEEESEEKTKLVNELKEFSDSKLKKLKKNDLYEYLKLISDDTYSEKDNKNEMISNLKKELSKFI